MEDSIPRRIAAFEEIRDLPFRASTHGEADCCCSTKATLLQEQLDELGLKSRHVLCYFQWDKLGLPGNVINIPHEALPTHQYLEVYTPETGSWVRVDPTWDKELQSVLPINTWDGIHATPCAVPVEKVCTEEEADALFEEYGDPVLTKKYFREMGAFLTALNEYFQEIRKKERAEGS